MKTFLWLVTIAFSILCFTSWALIEGISRELSSRDAGLQLSAPLLFSLRYHVFLLFCPLPWLVCAAWFSKRGDVLPATAFTFLGTVTLATACLFCAVTLVATSFIFIFLSLRPA